MKTAIRAAAAVVTLSAASASHAQQAVQWKVSDGGNGHWYQCRSTVGSGEVWSNSSVAAHQLGGHLATLTSAPENAWVYQLSLAQSAWRGRNGPLLGGYKLPNNTFRWVTDEPWGFAAWLSGEPNSGLWEPYLQFLGPQFTSNSSATWNDCDAINPTDQPMHSYIIEWSADCNNDGIVDYGQCRDGSLPDYNGNNAPDCCETGTPCVVGNYPVEWRVAEGGNGRWYQVMTYAVSPSWESARGDARSMGGDLTSFQSLAEMDFCLRLAEQRPMAWRRLPETGAWWGPWVGAFQEPGAAEPAGGWKWIDSPGLAFVSDNRMTFNNQASCCGGNEDRLFMYANGPAVRFEFLELNDIPKTGSCQGDCSHGPMVFSSVIEWSADCNNDGVVDYGQIVQGQLVDADANGVPDICEVDPCPGDITNGGTVDAADLSILLAAWGTNGQAEFDTDIDNSGLVDGGDLALVLGGWGPCPQ